MLRAMRDDFKKYSWTLWLVMLAFVGGFILTDAFTGQNPEDTGLIYIDDEQMVNGKEFQTRLKNVLENYKTQSKGVFSKSLINQLRLPEQIAQGLVNTALIRVEAEKMNITVSDEELRDKIVNHPYFQQDGKFVGHANYKRALSYGRVKVKDFENELRDQVRREKFQELVSGAMVVDEETLREDYKKEKDNAEVDLVRIKPERIKDDQIKLADDDPAVKEYYEKNKEDFKSREKRGGYVIAYKFDDYKKEVNITEKEVYDYFNTNKDDYRLPGKTKVSRILLNYDQKNQNEILKTAQNLQQELTPENFAEKAKALSQDNRAKQGGDFGYEGWKQFSKQEISIINGLDQGKISTPIVTGTGYAILYVPEKVKERGQNYNDVKDRISQILEDDAVNTLVNNKLQKIYDKLSGSDDIKAKAAEMNVTALDTGMLASGNPIADVDQLGYISRQMFTMEVKDTRFPVQFSKGIAILQLNKVEEPVVQPFEEVTAQAKSKVLNNKKLDMLMVDAKKYADELNRITDDKKREEYMKKNNLTADSATYKPGGKLSYLPSREGMDELIFSAEEKQFNAPLRFDTDVVIFSVKKKTVKTPEDFDKEKSEYYQQKVDEIKNSYFLSYMSNRKDIYKVSINQNLFDKIKTDVLSRFN
ncbi:MAG: hypothetical protein GY940_36030 [bacterium]|nr:hypothetical protein [bacterium]